ncbi:MAG: acyltransferase family protein [Candidatus Methylumidiphilus sp.]
MTNSTLVSNSHSNPVLHVPQICRGLACLFVALFHGITLVGSWYGVVPLSGLYNFGFFGVHLFFVISGLIILHAHYADIGHYKNIGHYLSKRIIRIYPLYLIVLIVWGGWRVFTGRLGIAEFLTNALFFSSDKKLIIPVAWTLAYELVFYLSFVTLIISKRLGLAVFAAWAGLVAFDVLHNVSDLPLFNLQNALFIIGMVAAVTLRTLRRRLSIRLQDICAYVFAASSLVLFVLITRYCAVLSHHGTVPIDVWGDPIITLGYGCASALLLLTALSGRVEHFVRRQTPLVAVGNASYSIYLVHVQIQRIVFNATRPLDWLWLEKTPLAANLLLVLVLAASVAAGIIIHKLLEKPLLNAGRKLLARTKVTA